MIIIITFVLFIIFFVSTAFLKAQYLTSKRPVDVLLNDRKSSPDFCPWEKISEEVIKFFVLIEDPCFYHHNGVNPGNTIRRGISFLFKKDQINHGSTISQQLAKNLYLPFQKTLFRKIMELFLCIKIERVLTKEEIFTFYLNIIYYGNKRYGITNASEYYFSKEPAELTANQAVIFACLIAAPNAAEPVHYPEKFFNLKKRKLEKCFQEGLISQEERNFFCSFSANNPDPEFAPTIQKTDVTPYIILENERFGPYHKSVSR